MGVISSVKKENLTADGMTEKYYLGGSFSRGSVKATLPTIFIESRKKKGRRKSTRRGFPSMCAANGI